MTDKQLETVIDDIAGPGWQCLWPREWCKINNILSHHCYPKETERLAPYTDSDDLSEQNDLESSSQFYTITNAIKPPQFPTALIFGGWDSSGSTKKERFLEQLKWARDKSELALNDILSYINKLDPEDFYYDESELRDLEWTIRTRDIACMENCLKKGAPVHSGSMQISPLYEAIMASFEEGVKLLLDSGAKQLKDGLGNTPLHYAVNDKNIMKMLIDNGADVNALNNDHETPLDKAFDSSYQYVTDNCTEIADLLRKHGGKHGTIHGAADGGDIEVVKEFLAKGADVNVKNKHGDTPLSPAVKRGYKDMAKLLISKGTGVNIKNEDAETPLHFAALNGHKEIAELLIANGADVNAKDYSERTPLCFAARMAKTETAELLIAKGAKVNAKDDEGTTPLYFATVKNRKKLAELLIANGADVNAKNNDGETPLDAVARKAHTETVEILRMNGGKTSEELKAEGK